MTKHETDQEKHNKTLEVLSDSIIRCLIHNGITEIYYADNKIYYINSYGRENQYEPISENDRNIKLRTLDLITKIINIYEKDINSESYDVSIDTHGFKFIAGVYNNNKSMYFSLDISEHKPKDDTVLEYDMQIGDIVSALHNGKHRLFEVIMIGRTLIMIGNGTYQQLVKPNATQLVCKVTNREDSTAPPCIVEHKVKL